MRMRRRWGGLVAAVAACAIVASLGASGVAAALAGPVSVPGVRPESPAVSGGRLVWADRRSSHYDVYLYDAPTRATRRVTDGSADHIQPAISGNLVVWTDYRNGDADIYGYDLAAGTERPLVVALGDQVMPSVSGRWLVWEDRGSGYSSSVRALDLSVAGARPFSVSSYARSPRVAGDLMVWEDTTKSAPDVKARNLATGARYDVATSSFAEILPATDGRYVAWAQDDGTDLDVRAFDTVAGRYFTCAAGSGEQSFPAVGNGVVYWIDNVRGKRLHVDSYDIASGRTARFDDYGTEDVAAVTASGREVGWLAKTGRAWQLRATFGAGELLGSALSRLVPGSFTAAPLARLSADADPPRVVSTSVSRGQLNVPRGSSFSVRFSKPLDPASVRGDTVRVLDRRGRPVRARLRYSALARAVTVTPSSPLGNGTFTLAVSPSVADPSGNALGEPLVVSFSTIGVLADATPPSAPSNLVSRVYQGNQVSLTWNASSDNVGVTGYLVYRSLGSAPIANFPADASFVASATATSIVVPLAADEKDKAFTYYYVVVARDAAMNVSAPSYNDAPDPHGTFTSGRSTNLCLRCHSVHGAPPTQALGAKSASACYACHGNTPATSAYGAASSMDVQADFRDDASISTAGPEVAGRGSIHRNTYMAVIQRECDACHTPHKKAYDPVAANSYNRLLRTQISTNPVGYRYNTDATAVANAFCGDCHGASGTNMALVGGATAWSDTGGDHYTVYAGPHSTVAANGGNLNPGIQCEACHNNHAAGATKLIDYRDSATSTAAYDQSGLCLACHSASGQETGKPNTWNGRDVKIEFARASHHPSTTVAGTWVPQTGKTVFSQTSQVEFGTDTLFQTVTNAADGNGSVVLDQYSAPYDFPAGPYLFFADALPRFDSLNASPPASAWNADFTPTNVTAPGAGANSTTKNGVVFAMQGGGSNVMRTYAPPANSGTGTWGTTANALWQNANAGSDTAFDTTDGYVWALLGGYTPTTASTNIRRTTNFAGTSLAWYAPGGANGPYFCTSASTPLALGAGSTLAWVPANGTRPERLYAVNRSGTTSRNGQLYFYNNPDAATGGTAWTSTTHVLGSTGTTSDTGSRMLYFRIGTTDYLYSVRGNANLEYLIQLANTTAAAGTVLDNGTANPWNANVAEGTSLVWNGDTTQAGFRLFAIKGGSTALKVATWDGSALVWSDGPVVLDTPAAGSYLAFVVADPAPGSVNRYYGSGTAQSGNVNVPGNFTAWNALTYTAQPAVGTTLTVKVQGSADGGGSWSDLATATSSPFDLSSIGPSYTVLRLVAQLTSTGDGTPRLDDWAVSADYDEYQLPSGSLTCVSCHNAHLVQAGTGAWQAGRVSDPANTKSAVANTTDFCLGCHTSEASRPVQGISGTSIVPYPVGFRPDAAWPFFTGWDKSSGSLGFKSSGHYATTGTKALCENCHDPHGSGNARLAAWTRPASFASGIAGTRDNTTANAAESNLCWQCHGNSGIAIGGFTGRTATGANGVGMDLATPFNAARAHPTAVSGKHSDTESASGLGAGSRHAECVDCHDPHAARAGLAPTSTSEAAPVLYGAVGVKPAWGTANWSAPASFSTLRLDGTLGDYESYLCFKCHSSYVAASADATVLAGITDPSGGFTETNIALEFNPANWSGHNVIGGNTWPKTAFPNGYTWATPNLSLAAGWSQNSNMTCSDCHSYDAAGARGPHGSGSKFMLVAGGTSDWWNYSISQWSSTMCARCHTTRTSNSAHNSGNHSSTRCQACHVRIPHGWKRPRMIGYHQQPATDYLPYSDPTGVTGLTGVRLSNYTASGPGQNNCYTNCGGHSSASGSLW